MRKWMLSLGVILLLGGVVLTVYHAMELHQESSVVQEWKPASQTTKTSSETKESDGPRPIIWSKRPKEGTQFGELQIPRLQVKVPIVSGVGDEDLKKGIGHHRNSVLPGEGDNSVLAGHRETALQHADQIKQGDQLIVSTDQGTFTYEVNKMWVTDAADRSVIVPHDKSKLTLYTCWPLDAIGYAPDRYIIQADLVQVTTD